MDGITILNEIITVIEPTPIGVWFIALIGATLCTILVAVAIAIGIRTKDSAGIGLGVLLGSIVVVPLWILVFAIHEDTQREPFTTIQYEVTISDDVSLNEFNEKYKIIEQREKIFVIAEKENKEED